IQLLQEEVIYKYTIWSNISLGITTYCYSSIWIIAQNSTNEIDPVILFSYFFLMLLSLIFNALIQSILYGFQKDKAINLPNIVKIYKYVDNIQFQEYLNKS
ncbi:hypothetical protein MXB_2804, partial [Myxobolus squamalis]